ncbi:TetR family transcriptional regulator C-terminal domain-containing protein [Microbacterium marinilacus]|uniref:TetR family transcriptional regulator n=1 Tax=Microbacterium marinilacus TaxID=415209 RepID=A0ABP7B578_9MICO|nr:TetR family transcriptional regulator C-terminal domain-containing protein [Microbacterium marinilacus]MBY0689993.1 TetR family transcriptional regulator C-terminal domain-containing protein [Microbacterium marinilacus]
MSTDSRPARRPRAPRLAPEARRALIADAACAIAAEDGLAAITMRAVAARAGVAPALVAHYAESGMDGLVALAFERIVSRELVDVAAIVAAQPAPRAAMAAMIRTLAGGERDEVTGVWVEAWALGRRNEALATTVRAQMDAWQRLVQDVVDAGVATGDFRVTDPALAAWQVLGMIDGTGAQSLVRWGETGDRSALLLRAVEAVLGATT